MKQSILTVLLICGIAFAMAEQASNPMNDYLKNPSHATYKLAVDSLTDAIAKGEKLNMSKISLAYITSFEADRLLEDLRESTDSLSSGERFTLANILLGKEDYDAAIKLYDSLNQSAPNWSCPWRHKGEALYKTKDFNAAAAALQEAIATNEEHYDAYVWMAFTLNELGRYSEALVNLEKAKTLSPEAEESEDEILSQDKIDALYKELKIKAH